MKKIIKKITSLLLVTAMLLGISAAGITLIAQAAETLTENGFTYTVTDETATITDCGSLSGDITLPETLGGYPVTALGKGSFSKCGEIGTLYIHEGITDIFSYPYNGYQGLFSSCKVKFFAVDENNPNYSSDENGVLYDKDKTILYQFPKISDIARFTVPEGVVKLENYAFRLCNKLEWVEMGRTVEEVGYCTFSKCENLIGVNLGMVKVIGTQAFEYCSKLQSVNFGRRLQKIYSHAFSDCDGITEMSFPNTLDHVDDLAFFGCSNIEKFTVASGGTTFSSDENGVLFGGGGTELVKFPPASKITSYEIPDTVTYIRAFAFGFESKNIEKITGGSGLELIGSLAFSQCESLEEVILDDGTNELTLYNEVFSYCPRLRKVVFPDNFTTAKYTDIFAYSYGIESVTVGSKLAEAKFMRSSHRDGCEFLGWYIGDTKVESPYATNGERVTFTAVFDPMKYSVTLDAEGGMFESKESQEFLAFAPDEEITGLPVPTKSGFDFAGWDGMPADGMMPAESITLKAKWTAQADADETLSIRAELLYFDFETNEWIVTEKITNNDTLKLRIYIDTSYYTSSGRFVLFYEDWTYGHNYETNKTYALRTNTDPESSAAKTGAMGSFTVAKPNSAVMKGFLENGYIDETFAQDYWAMLIDFRLDSYTCQKLDGDKWFAEIDFTSDYRTNMGTEFVLLNETVASTENPEGYTDIRIGNQYDLPQNTESLSKTNIKTDLQGTLGDSSICYEFHAADGRFENGTWNFYGYGSVGLDITSRAPGEPTREGYTFVGWVDQYGNTAEVPQVLGRRNYCFFAVWEINSYKVYFKTNSDMSAEPVEYTYGEEIMSFDLVPEAVGLSFEGWCFEDGTPVEYPFVMPADDVTLYASYSVNDYTIAFDTQGGTSVETITANYGSAVEYPEEPEKTGYVFMGWSTERDGEPVRFPETMPAEGLILYAVWKPADYTVKYHIGDETEVFTVSFGSSVPVPDLTAYEGIEVVGWKNTDGEAVQLPVTMPADNLEFTAKLKITESFENPELSAEYDDDCFAEDVKLNVTEIDGASKLGNVYLVEGEFYYQIGYMNIKMLNEKSEVVQPQNGKKVTLRIPVPEKYKGKTDFIINHWFTEGGREQLTTDKGDITVENGYLCFKVGKFSEFAIYVKGSTELTKAPSKTSYYYKQELDLSGIELSVVNADGTVETVTDTSKMTVSGFDSTKIGEQTVTVEYEGETVEFKVNVNYAWWQWIIRILLLGFLWY